MEKAGNRFSKPVAFNKTNDREARILKHVGRRNFSKYVKDLIWADMAGKEKTAPPAEQETPQVQTAAERLQNLKQNRKPAAAPIINLPKN